MVDRNGMRRPQSPRAAHAPAIACAVPARRIWFGTVPRTASPPLAKPPARPRHAAEPTSEHGEERSDNVSRAYRDLRRVIVWGQLPPGARISERVIATRLGLSRTPVRSALHRLQQEGFVSSSTGAGERRLIVAPLTMADGQELFHIVGHLEGLAARIAADLPPDRRKTLAIRMRELNAELAAQARARGTAARFFDLDLRFHQAFVESVVGPRLLTLHRAIKPQCERYARLYASVLLDELPTSIKEHEVIAGSIARGDPDAAQAAVETNWGNAASRLAHIIWQVGERGSWVGATHDGAAPAPRSRPARRRSGT